MESDIVLAGVPETQKRSHALQGGTQVKGAGPVPRRNKVLDLRSDCRRNPVAKAFVGSNPTPRTTCGDQIPKYGRANLELKPGRRCLHGTAVFV